MTNPLDAVKREVGGMFCSVMSNDCNRPFALLAAAVITPFVALAAFVKAFFQEDQP